MLFDINCMSDFMTIKVDNMKVATFICLKLGYGKYEFILEDDEGNEDAYIIPMFIFSDIDDIDKWVSEKFDIDTVEELIKDVIINHKDELIKSLRRIVYGKLADRKSFNKGLELIEGKEKELEWINHWNDTRRTSLNDINSFALDYANMLEKEGDE